MKSTFRSFLAAAVVTSASHALAQPVLPYWTADEETVFARFVAAAGPSARTVAVVPTGEQPAWLSIDRGDTWRTFEIGGTAVVAAWASPWQETLYAGTGPGMYNQSEMRVPAALHRSSDGGATWTPLAQSRFEGRFISDLVPGPGPGLVYAAQMEPDCYFAGLCRYGGARLLVSRDGGDSWQLTDSGVTGPFRKVYVSSDPDIVYVASDLAFFASRDGARTWRQVQPDSRRAMPYRSYAVDRSDPLLVYAYDALTRAFTVSEDGGNTWRARTHPDPEAEPGSASALMRMVPDPAQRGRLYAIGLSGRIHESRDMGGTWRVVSAHTAGDLGPAVVVSPQGTTRSFLAATQKVRIEEAPPFTAGQGLWWNPGENGAGLSITQHPSGQVFVVWFTYAADGSPTWYFASGGRWAAARTFQGTLYQANANGKPGPSYDPASLRIREVGEITLAFDDSDNATYTYRFSSGLQGSKRITRQMFGAVGWTYPLMTEPSDLWWNPSQPGWGVGIAQQAGRLFVTVFTYDTGGNPTWWFMSGPRLTGYVPEATDIVFTSRGSPLDQPYNGFAFRPQEMGTGRISLHDGGTRAVFTFPDGERQVTVTLTRQPF